MDEVQELSQRLAAALQRISDGIAALPDPAAQSGPGSLLEELESERLVNAQLAERVRVIREKQETMVASLEARNARMVAQLDQVGLELQRLKKSNISLRENNRVLREALERGIGDAGLINKSLAAELDALRVARSAEIVELEDVMAELRPIVEGHSHA